MSMKKCCLFTQKVVAARSSLRPGGRGPDTWSLLIGLALLVPVAWVHELLHALAALVVAGCQGAKPKQTDELATVMQADMVKPVVAGPHQELVVTRQRETILKGVLRAFKETGVSPVLASEPPEGTWVLGRSLAGRQVLAEVVPIVPGRFTVRITVDGADQLTTTLLHELMRELSNRIG